MGYDFSGMMAQNMLLMHGKPSTFIPYWRITMIKKSLISAAVAASLFALSSTASADAYLHNWFIDPDGSAGVAGKTSVADYLNISGTSFIQNTFSAAPAPGVAFSFQEAANFTSSTTGAFPVNGFAPGVTGKFTATGNGTVGGNLSFSGGLLELYSGSAATAFGTFELQSGEAVLAPGGLVPNGFFTLTFKALTLDAGYLFDSSLKDLSNIVSDPNGLLFGFSTTNATELTGQTANAPLVADYSAKYGAPAFGTTDNGTTSLYLGNGGQYRLSVPEPSMLSLLGLALVGFGFTTRRKSKV